MTGKLIESVPSSLESKLKDALLPDETVTVKLKGAHKEILVCTDKRLIIIKSGFMTGSTFGINLFQIPLRTVSSVEVKFGVLTGYFEVSTGGMQNTSKSIWGTKSENNPMKAPNCVSLNTREQKDKFREACSIIMDLVQRPQRMDRMAFQGAPSTADEIFKLASLLEKGLINDQEFASQKQRILNSGSDTKTSPTGLDARHSADNAHADIDVEAPLNPAYEAALRREVQRLGSENTITQSTKSPPVFGKRQR